MTATPEIIEAPVSDAQDMGPAVLPGFEDVAGLETLAAKSASKRERTEVAQKDATTQQQKIGGSFPLTQVQTLLTQVDTVVSAVAEIPTVPPDQLTDIARGIHPLAEYYANQKPTVATLVVVAGLSVLSFVAIKVVQYRATKGRNTDAESQTV